MYVTTCHCDKDDNEIRLLNNSQMYNYTCTYHVQDLYF